MHVAVIGGGAIGLASAYHLAGLGHRVVLVERDGLGSGASANNAGWLVPSMATPVAGPGTTAQIVRWLLRRDSPLYVKPSADPRFARVMLSLLRASRAGSYAEGVASLALLARSAMRDFDALRADGLDFESREGPLTQLFTDEHHLEAHAEQLEATASLGALGSSERLDRAAVQAAVPGVSSEVVGGIRTHGNRSVDPGILMGALVAGCSARGVELRTDATARLDRRRGRVELITGSESLTAAAFVVAAGVWSNGVIRPLGERISLVAGKGYGFDLAPLPGFPKAPLYLSEAKVAVTPLTDRIRLAGTMGFGGNDLGVATRRARGILTSAQRFLPEYGIAEAAGAPFAGLRPMTPDGVPVLGRLRRHPEVVVATGHQMLGLTLAPTSGRLVAELIDSGRDSIDPAFDVR